MVQQTISKMETVQTAVNWLLTSMHRVDKMDWDILFMRAKEMEKEQIETAFKDGIYKGVLTDINYKNCDEEAEFYYNSRYN